MTLDPKDAAASLHDISAIERRTRETLFYAGSGWVFILWGGLSFIGNLVNWQAPQRAGIAWLAIDIVGIAATFAIVAAHIPRHERRAVALRWGASYLAFLGYGAVIMAELWPLSARQQQAFWPTLILFGYVLAGIWIGRFFLYLGLAATALLLIGYFGMGEWFLPWMAVVLGGGLIGAGLWLRRSA